MNLQVSLIALGTLLVSAAMMAFDYPQDAVIYEGAAGDTKVKITASVRPFSRASHTTTELQGAGSEKGRGAEPATVDGKVVVGTDRTLPEDGVPQLSNLTIWFGERKVSVPTAYLYHVFVPNLRPANIQKGHAHTLVAFSADARAVWLSLGVGDGGGSSTYSLIVTVDGKVSLAPVQRPEP